MWLYSIVIVSWLGAIAMLKSVALLQDKLLQQVKTGFHKEYLLSCVSQKKVWI